jgi:CheY-like chemotaxis protein
LLEGRKEVTPMRNSAVIVVCGDATRRESFVDTFVRAGWAATASVSSLSEAAGLVREAGDACVIIDAELADMPGLTAVRILHGLCPHVKVIFTAPENTRDLEEKVQALNVFYYYISSEDRGELVTAVEEAVGARRPAKARRQPKVLIVDDDVDFQLAVRTILETAGYDILSAYSEREGLEAARRERPDAILLDIIIGSTTGGIEFCHQARRDPQIRHTPIVAVSAIEERLGLHCPPNHEPGLFPVDAYLRKPVTIERMLAELKRLIPAEN